MPDSWFDPDRWGDLPARPEMTVMGFTKVHGFLSPRRAAHDLSGYRIGATSCLVQPCRWRTELIWPTTKATGSAVWKVAATAAEARPTLVERVAA